ncbi:MAG: hypothetical protein KQH63_04950 [Desulfobulbaceae bacterium]|nr:hypothetical protein [Desulfobulbaceae bacterium]
MKRKIFTLIVCSLLFLQSEIAFSTMSVIDSSNLAQAVLQVKGQIEEITHLVESLNNQVIQIRNQTTQIENQRIQLQKLSNGEWGSYYGLLNDIAADSAMLTGLLDQIGYGGNIATKWGDLFPDDFSGMTLGEWTTYLSRWDRMIKDVSQNAAQSQGCINRVQANSRKAQQILVNSNTSDGEIAQLQSLNQMASLTQGSMNDLVSMSATIGRVISSGAARDAAEREVLRAAAADLRKDYADKGSAPESLTDFP